MTARRWPALVALGVLSGTLHPVVARAQRRTNAVLVARVLEATTGNPLLSAEVRLLELGRSAHTDAQGLARFDAVPPGNYELAVRLIGYEPVAGRLTVHAGDSIQTAVVLRPLTVLDTIRVVGHALSPQMRGFALRERKAFGHFLNAPLLKREGGRDLQTVLLAHLPGLTQIWDDSSHRYQLASTRGPQDFSGKPCFIDAIYIDDTRLPDPPDLTFLHTDNLAGVEFYSASNIPVQYRTPGSACGVLLFWTKFIAR
ncbi:MAG TPA: carboxypeptidase regulatory-like domain-containing protein [Gemmatimonadaceae bacterium]|nr:carboxypeptidase regulatory-like domain-containing protein [Gemmatimonadaceae bacterium]